MKIEDLEGVGPVVAAKLQAAGVATTDALLETAGPAAGRKKLAAVSDLTEKQLLELVNRCDLYRLDGVGSEYSDLLEAAGVDSCTELAQRNAANLAAKLAEVNEAKSLTRRVPGEATVAQWIDQAKTLPKVVTH